MMKNLRAFVLPLVVPALIFVCWYILTPIIDNNMILPPIHRVVNLLSHPFDPIISMGSLVRNFMMSLARVLVAYTAASLCGIVLGIAIGYSARIDTLLSAFIEFFRPLPPMAWVPLLLAWTGILSLANVLHLSSGPLYPYLDSIKLSMLFIIFIGGFFPVLTSTIQGVRSTPNTLIEAARVLGASERDIFCKILLPSAAPGIFNGLRIALSLSWSCLIASEMLPGSLSGIGYLIIHAYTMARIDIVIAGMCCIGAAGALMDWTFHKWEEQRFRWVRQVR